MAIFLDTGVLYALYDKKDSNHMNSVGVLSHALAGRWGRPFLSNYIVLESTLLLRSKLGSSVAREFLRFAGASGITELIVDQGVNDEAKRLFSEDEALSLTDAATIALMRTIDAGNIGTYDKRSFSGYFESIVGPGYWESLETEERKRLVDISTKPKGRATA